MKRILLSSILLAVWMDSASAASKEQLLEENRALKAELAALRTKLHPRASSILKNNSGLKKNYTTKIASDWPVDSPVTRSMWQGVYGGLSAGYGWGVTRGIQNRTYALADYDSKYGYSLGAIGNYNTQILTPFAWFNFNPPEASYNISQAITNVPFNSLIDVFLGNFGLTALAGNNVMAMSQSGFTGGGQIGVNWQGRFGDFDTVYGFETDIQGSAQRGSAFNASSPNQENKLILSGDASASQCSAPSQAPMVTTSTYFPPAQAVGVSGTCIVTAGNGGFGRSTFTSVSVSSRVNWVGTVRSRFGWLAAPNLLVYATGGLAYGEVNASVSVSQINNLTNNVNSTTNAYAFSDPNLPSPNCPTGSATACPTTYNPVTWNSNPISSSTSSGNLSAKAFVGQGKSQYNAIRVGWTVGTGLEFMITPNWSIKAEGLYYYLGSATLLTPVSVGSPYGGTANVTQTTVSWNGIVARGGANYHFSWVANPVIVKY